MAGLLPPGLQPNVLYLMADDMRPQLGCYGHHQVSTPNLDKLAAGGLLFQNAYTQFAYCAPSRASFLTGRRPERTRVLNFVDTFRDIHGASWVSLPQHFKNNGYFTTAAGKLYHDGADDPASWSFPSNQTAWVSCNCGIGGDICGADTGSNFCGVTALSKVQYTDEELVLAEGLRRMHLAHASKLPWFVGIGVHRPHHPSRLPFGWYGPQILPFVGSVKPPRHPLAPEKAPWMSGNWYGGDYTDKAHGCPDCTVPSDRAVEYRRWYYASVAYADHVLGAALAKLEELQVADRTMVVFHSDHGYQLGELNEWSKKTNTELATRVPLIVRVPWAPKAVGAHTRVHAELVDLYRTLSDLAGIGTGIQPGVQGTSLAPLFQAPDAPAEGLAGKRAYSQIGSCACREYTRHGWTGLECDAGRCHIVPPANFDFMGYSVRTPEGWRLTAWVPMDNETARVDWSRGSHLELYDLRTDKGVDFDYDGYSKNVADEHPHLVGVLQQELKAAVDSWY